jgi:uncharacterized protein YjbI with pentapeptide repeats
MQNAIMQNAIMQNAIMQNAKCNDANAIINVVMTFALLSDT